MASISHLSVLKYFENVCLAQIKFFIKHLIAQSVSTEIQKTVRTRYVNNLILCQILLCLRGNAVFLSTAASG